MRLLNIDNDRFARLALACALLLVVVPAVACGSAPEDAGTGEGGAGEAADAAAGGDEDAGTGEATGDAEGDAGEEHGAAEGIPNRAEEEARDEYSKPLEVYELTGIGEGDTVVDLDAFSGYNTYLLSGVVGPGGTVHAVGANEGLEARRASGDLADAANVTINAATAEVPDGSADAVLMIRTFHLAPDHAAVLAETMRMLEPGGRVAVVEVRLGDSREGYEHDTHRSGEDTIIGEFTDAGFELVTESDILRIEGDDYTVYGNPRYITDRMLLIFAKPE